MYVEFIIACLVRSAVHGQTPFCMQNSFVYVIRVAARSAVHGQPSFTIIVPSSAAGTFPSAAAGISDAEARGHPFRGGVLGGEWWEGVWCIRQSEGAGRPLVSRVSRRLRNPGRECEVARHYGSVYSFLRPGMWRGESRYGDLACHFPEWLCQVAVSRLILPRRRGLEWSTPRTS